MPNFINPPYRTVQNHRYKEEVNEPVNLDYVISVKQIRVRYYPDNEGVPALVFRTVNPNCTVKWVFNNDTDRLDVLLRLGLGE